jgi:putative SOS response-associated peptidase YedK
MCGRYASSRGPDDLVPEFGIRLVQPELPFEPDYNVAPTKNVPAVLQRSPRRRDGTDEPPAPVRQLRMVRWGLVPSWAPNPSVGSRFINARAETAAAKPAYRQALSRRRCLLPADGYYEWYAATSRGRRQPFFIRSAGGGGLAMAGLYELWLDPVRGRDDPDAWLWTAAIVTTAAEPGVARLHDRMPLVIPPERYAAWLDPSFTDVDAVARLLVPPPPGRLEAYPVSTAVGDVRVNGPHLIHPVPVAEEGRTVDATLF